MLEQLMRAIGLLVTIVCAGLATPATAEQYEIACFWRAPSVLSADPDAREAAKFFDDPNDLAYFRLNLKLEKAENSDPNKTQDIIFPTLGLYTYPERFTVTVYSPNIKGLKERMAEIRIDINRFSLRSTMWLAVSEKGRSGQTALWRREGQCFKREM